MHFKGEADRNFFYLIAFTWKVESVSEAPTYTYKFVLYSTSLVFNANFFAKYMKLLFSALANH